MNVRKITVSAILAALSVVLSAAESLLLPDIGFLPPGAKPGFANIAVMVTASFCGTLAAFAVSAIKSLFVLFTRGATAFVMSAAGGLLSTAAVCALLRCSKQPFSFVGISILCAELHNIGQLCAAMLVTGTPSLIGYAPALLLFGAVAGVVTGTALRYAVPAIRKILIKRG